jgi:bifunctional non-homologous end joining protein LigD
MRFIEPAAPTTKKTSPIGPQWLHEVKFDGFRIQIHKRGDFLRMYSRNRNDLLHRFPDVRDHLTYLSDCIIDGELVACDSDGKPDFGALMRGGGDLCLWCFDLLAVGDEDIRHLALVDRKARLRQLLIELDDDRLRYSEEFDNPHKLLAVAAKMGLEGVVSKRKDRPYRSGKLTDWVKVKTPVWREANKNRFEHLSMERKPKQPV